MDTLDHLVAHHILLKREELSKQTAAHSDTTPQQHHDDDQDFGLLSSFMDLYKGINTTIPSNNPYKFLKDAILSLLFAARDTTSASLSWFFYLTAISGEARKIFEWDQNYY